MLLTFEMTDGGGGQDEATLGGAGVLRRENPGPGRARRGDVCVPGLPGLLLGLHLCPSFALISLREAAVSAQAPSLALSLLDHWGWGARRPIPLLSREIILYDPTASQK